MRPMRTGLRAFLGVLELAGHVPLRRRKAMESTFSQNGRPSIMRIGGTGRSPRALAAVSLEADDPVSSLDQGGVMRGDEQ